MTDVIGLDGRLRGHDPGGTRTPSIGALPVDHRHGSRRILRRAERRSLRWPVPLFVYLQWEKDGTDPPPADVLDAARAISQRRPIEPPAPNLSRRQFLGSIVGLLSLVAAGVSVGTQSFPSAVSVGGAGRQVARQQANGIPTSRRSSVPIAAPTPRRLRSRSCYPAPPDSCVC